MNINRTKNAARNVIVDGMLKVTGIILPFVMRTILLHYLGIEYLGLGGLFRSTLSVLNLTELGVGSAMVYSMYRPITEHDTDTICALMRLYRRYYRLIGLFIAVVGLALTPFIRNLIKGHVPDAFNVYVLYLMNLAATVFTYWLFAYKNSLLNAHQRVDVASMIALIVSVVEFILKFTVLVLFRNYYLFLLVQLVMQIAKNIITAIRVNAMYPQYKPRGTLSKEKVRDINQRIRNLFTARFSAVITGSMDTLVITAFMGLTVLAVYQNYQYIVTSLRSILEVILGACIAGVGHSLITETHEKNFHDLLKLSMLFFWVMGVCSAMLLCLYQPFMRMWMGEENMLDFSYVICFTILFYSLGVNRLVNMFKDAAGIWHRDRFRPLTAALVNLALNLTLIRFWGLYGVLLSTVISVLLVQIPWLVYNLFHEVFPTVYMKQYIVSLVRGSAVAVLGCTSSWFICAQFDLVGLRALLVNGLVALMMSNIFCYLGYGDKPMFWQTVHQILAVFKRKISGRSSKKNGDSCMTADRTMSSSRPPWWRNRRAPV
ncbi:MAG: oligosaccharide flippase family protein [Lachnospiraceae bacterium]|nr:oligosaccharide flippase family protein [Lachnospiraceae bacterium]